jgi:hypothetical protein
LLHDKWRVRDLTIFLVCLGFLLIRHAKLKEAFACNFKFRYARIVSPHCFFVAHRSFPETIPDAGADGSFSRRGVRDRYQVMRNRQLIFSFSSFLNYPLRTNGLTAQLTVFVFSLRAEAMC